MAVVPEWKATFYMLNACNRMSFVSGTRRTFLAQRRGLHSLVLRQHLTPYYTATAFPEPFPGRFQHLLEWSVVVRRTYQYPRRPPEATRRRWPPTPPIAACRPGLGSCASPGSGRCHGVSCSHQQRALVTGSGMSQIDSHAAWCVHGRTSQTGPPGLRTWRPRPHRPGPLRPAAPEATAATPFPAGPSQ